MRYAIRDFNASTACSAAGFACSAAGSAFSAADAVSGFIQIARTQFAQALYNIPAEAEELPADPFLRPFPPSPSFHGPSFPSIGKDSPPETLWSTGMSGMIEIYRRWVGRGAYETRLLRSEV